MTLAMTSSITPVGLGWTLILAALTAPLSPIMALATTRVVVSLKVRDIKCNELLFINAKYFVCWHHDYYSTSWSSPLLWGHGYSGALDNRQVGQRELSGALDWRRRVDVLLLCRKKVCICLKCWVWNHFSRCNESFERMWYAHEKRMIYKAERAVWMARLYGNAALNGASMIQIIISCVLAMLVM